jgi:hypothetical protein
MIGRREDDEMNKMKQSASHKKKFDVFSIQVMMRWMIKGNDMFTPSPDPVVGKPRTGYKV